MTIPTQPKAMAGTRWAKLAAGAALLALLCGCVVYPVGYIGAPHRAYWYGHDRDWH